MPRKLRCPRPINPILMMGRRGHQLFQRISNNVCAVAGARNIGGGGPGPAPSVADFIAYAADNGGVLKGLVKGTGSFTFARATEASVTDFEGLVKTALVNELRFEFGRRVENVHGRASYNSENINDGSWVGAGGATITGANTFTFVTGGNPQIDADGLSKRVPLPGTLKARATFDISCDVTVNVRVNFRSGTDFIPTSTVEVTGGAGTQRLSFINPTDFTTNEDKWIAVQLVAPSQSGTVTINRIQFEDVTGQANQNPSEYVSVGVVPEHGVNVDGVKYFNYANNNSVSPGGVVTESKGATFSTVPRALYEPAATNLSNTNDDLTGGAETVTIAATGNHTLSVGGSAAVTVAAGTATGTGFGQATEGSPVTFNITGTGTVTLTLNSGTLGTADKGYVLKQVEVGAIATSFVESPGGGGTRTADDGSSNFDFANWLQEEGTWYGDVWFSDVSLGTNRGVFSIANSGNNVLYERDRAARSRDIGDNIALTDGSQINTTDNRYRMVVDFGTGDTLEVGVKDVDGAGSFVWDTTPPNYAGAFISNNVINIAYNISAPLRFRDLKGYTTRKGQQWIEDNL